MFAWNAYEAFEVDPDFIYHHLNVNSIVLPRKQHPGAYLKSTLMLSGNR